MPAGTLEPARQVAKKRVAHLEMRERRLGKRIGKAHAQDDQRPPQYRADRIEECRPGLMEAHTPIDGAGETIATRERNGIMTEKNEGEEAEQAPYVTRCKRQQKECRVERHQNRERNQETEQKL